jgi:glutamyl-tRNA synthetase
MGYLPEALRTYLVRLGWAHGDDEIMTTEQMIEWFGFDGMNKSAARFDYDKLDALNAHYMRDMKPEILLERILSILPEIDGGNNIASALTDSRKQWLVAALPALAERAKTLVDVIQSAEYLYTDRPLPMDEKASSLTSDASQEILHSVIDSLEANEDWSHDGISHTLKSFCETNDLKLGKVAQPIRAALTGKATSPGAFDMLLILGKEESISRIRDVL